MAKLTYATSFRGKTMPGGQVDLGVLGTDIREEHSEMILDAGAGVLLNRLREHLKKTTHDANAAIRGRLAASLTTDFFYHNGTHKVYVQPEGKHHGKGVGKRTRAAGYHRPKTGEGVSKNRRHHGMTNAVSAMDVGYYLEYGTPRMRAEHWMQIVAEKSEDEVHAAMEAAWDKYLESIGL